jgi:phage tail-like protein
LPTAKQEAPKEEEPDPYAPSLPVAFFFKVVFQDTKLAPDASFQEVSGLSSELETEDVIEGGENTYVQRLPKGVKHPLLELKRGIAPDTSELMLWCRETMEWGFPLKTKSLNVYLMNEKQDPLRGWAFVDAYPVKWEFEAFNSTKNEVAIEKIALSYTYLQRLF